MIKKLIDCRNVLITIGNEGFQEFTGLLGFILLCPRVLWAFLNESRQELNALILRKTCLTPNDAMSMQSEIASNLKSHVSIAMPVIF